MTREEALKKVKELRDEYLAEEQIRVNELKRQGRYHPNLDGPKSDLELEFERKSKSILAQIDE